MAIAKQPSTEALQSLIETIYDALLPLALLSQRLSAAITAEERDVLLEPWHAITAAAGATDPFDFVPNVDVLLSSLSRGMGDGKMWTERLAALGQFGSRAVEMGIGFASIRLEAGLTVEVFVSRLFEQLLLRVAALRAPAVLAVLQAVQLVRLENGRPRFDLANVGTLLSNPGKYLETSFGPQALATIETATNLADRVLRPLAGLPVPADIFYGSDIGGAAPPFLLYRFGDYRLDDATGRFAVSIIPVPVPDGGPAFRIRLGGTGEVAFPICEQLTGRIAVDAPTVVALDLRFNGDLGFSAGPPAVTFTVSQADDARWVFGDPESVRLEISGFSAKLAMSADDVGFAIDLARSRAVFDASDGLLRQAIPKPIGVPFNLGLDWTWKHGVQFRGGAGLTVKLPLRLEFGPVSFTDLDLGINLGGPGSPGNRPPGLGLSLSTSLGFKLGPVSLVATGFGVSAALEIPGDHPNIGFGELSVPTILPPNGVGLSVETDVLRLGGFLQVDISRGRYVGAVELSLFKKLELSAICVITTKLPDGTDGFSLLVVIAVKFPVPIPLGYNFYLAGVGGVLGIQRGFDVGKLRDGLQSGVLDRVLFPENVLGDIDRAVADLDTVFPIAPGGFLVGPTVTIEWNQPALLTAKLAIVLSFEKSFKAAMAGVVRLALPDPAKPVLQLKAGFIGTLDFDAGVLSFDASIYDSFFGVGDFKIYVEGDVALRISWGAQKDFVLTVGGFHPTYKPPEHLKLPPLKRVTLSVLRDNPRLTFTAYFAITTNTVQFGARAELYVGLGPVEIVGALGFDALFQFNPFRFALSIEAHLAVRFMGADVLAVGVALQLEGPTPWYVKGTASVKILFFEVHAEFETRFGEVLEQPRQTLALLPVLRAELDKPSSWTVLDTSPAGSLIARRPLRPGAEGPDAFVLETAGRIAIKQNVLPFGRTLETYGQQEPTDAARFDVQALRIAGIDAAPTATTEPFAPANFKKLSDRDKLTAPSYEAMAAGVEAAIPSADVSAGTGTGAGFSAGTTIRARAYRYECALSDRGATAALSPKAGTTAELTSLLAGSAAAQSSGAQARRVAAVGQDLRLPDERFAVVAMTNAVVAADLPRSEANDLVDELLGSGGLAFGTRGTVVVVAAVAPASPAAAAGVVVGDEIMTMDGTAVRTVADARSRAAGTGGRAARYVLRSNGIQRTVTVGGARDPSSLIVLPAGLLAA